MAKISPVSIKYIIYARFEAEGTIEKPDVIGALFGQTEGLLGEELELRELQKEGKVGRIDVNIKSENGKTVGEIEIPCSIDKAETTIIAAALETIERIGPSDAKIEITKIEDVRKGKRNYIIERAKKLLDKIEGTTDSREIENAVKDSNKLGRLQEYGAESLPAGDISGKEIIVVEGRADVITLLKAGINNIIAMNGTILPKTIKELSLDKEVTLFVDGDRGGKLIAKNSIKNARINYIAVAPDGKEVEELTQKEILMALRKKIPSENFLKEKGEKTIRATRDRADRTARDRAGYRREKTDYRKERADYRREREEYRKEKTGARERAGIRGETETKKDVKIKKLTAEELKKIREISEEITGTRGAIILDNNLKIIKKAPISQLHNLRFRTVYAIVIDGTATMSVINAIEKLNCEHLVARNFTYSDTRIDLVSL